MTKHLKWEAPEFEYHPKDKSWFLIPGAVAVVLFIWSALTGNLLFALLIVLAFFSFLIYAFKKPTLIRIAITSQGIKINRSLYEYENLDSFWIFYDPDRIKELSLKSKKTIMPYIKVSLGEENPVKVRRALVKYIPEKKQEESFIDNLSRNLRF
ncbi:MAG: hypothetical protein CO003_00585 [Candidatus Portnoybacteria bacterium CG_4_8_14_3_um_filter_44_15]|uniref:DUF5673 domain-containing protein n=2 Tax=Candidatus Portnoyibacteriota TaxID=1817913 RepID=A0A2M7YLF7_9BACT|nr:MAG: hypothetical protein COX45_01670 [Candidatus Portnoybacteria bacterium CG23_combo_of_CG06-09_8_20_14_all_44_36]PIW74824.1 MAG: hypothetical protein CO003_00585 [Candidatus Portnoybacteria bacterium CG_4_8_14_3_um_filter_44_15]PJA63817.1 MAG: hypothetical protein CO160_01885 [Candidatus Portnoybacteria bacterium CG_4_9_14_3_um_filter_43_11]